MPLDVAGREPGAPEIRAPRFSHSSNAIVACPGTLWRPASNSNFRPDLLLAMSGIQRQILQFSGTNPSPIRACSSRPAFITPQAISRSACTFISIVLYARTYCSGKGSREPVLRARQIQAVIRSDGQYLRAPSSRLAVPFVSRGQFIDHGLSPADARRRPSLAHHKDPGPRIPGATASRADRLP